MKYTRVKAVTCALTASVIIFGSAAHTNASSVSYDLPAAGVGLVLEEGSSLSEAQEAPREEASPSEPEAQETPEAPEYMLSSAAMPPYSKWIPSRLYARRVVLFSP